MGVVHIRLTVEGHEIEGAVELPDAPSPRRVLLPVLQNLTGALISLGQQKAEEAGERISCAKGCDVCCRQMVPISPAEAYAIAAMIDELPPAQAAEILERFDQAVEALEERGLVKALRNRAKLGGPELQELDRAYFAAGVACPFLVDRACSIHAARPLACREFLVTSPAAFCRTPTADAVRPLALAAKMSVALTTVDQAPWLPLVLAREFVSKHREKIPSQVPADLLRRILADL